MLACHLRKDRRRISITLGREYCTQASFSGESGGIEISASKIETSISELHPNENVPVQCKDGSLITTSRYFHQPGKLNSLAYASLLRNCGKTKALYEGKQIHAHILRNEQEQVPFLSNLLIDMYGKCEAVESASVVFERLGEQNVFSWTTMISVYVQHGQPKRALKLLQEMHENSVVPNKVTLITVINACCHLSCLALGKIIHTHIIQNGFDLDVYVQSSLVNLYGKCGYIEFACNIFDRMSQKDVISWNIVIAAYIHNQENVNQALQLFQQMLAEGTKPNKISFICALSACSEAAALTEGRLLHASIIHDEVESDIFLRTALLTMYGKCGNLEAAREIFDNTTEPNVVSWNAMVAAYTQQMETHNALKLFRQMLSKGMEMDKATFLSILGACFSPTDLADGRFIHACIFDNQHEPDTVLGNALIHMYGKCESLSDAHNVFKKLHKPNIVSWNSIIAANTQQDSGKEALRIFWNMQQQNTKPDHITFITTLQACSITCDLLHGCLIHAFMIHFGIEPQNVVVETCLLNMYGKCGSLNEAYNVFNRMHKHNVVSWNAMIASLSQHGYENEAFDLFLFMQKEGMKADDATFIGILNASWSPLVLPEGRIIHASTLRHEFGSEINVSNTLMNMYGKCGSLGDVYRVFNTMYTRDLVSWTALIAANAQRGFVDEACHLFQEMECTKLRPDNVTFVSILDLCASAAALMKGKLVHAYVLDNGFEHDLVISTALINMYGKCGNMIDACMIFDEMPEQGLVSWNALTTAYAQHGYATEALQLFQEIERRFIELELVTYVSILSACSHAGHVEMGWHYFISLSTDHHIPVATEHCRCMTDLLGRGGQLDVARDFIKEMPFQPDIMVWMSLLAACQSHGKLKQGQDAANHVLRINQQNPAAYVLLSNLHALEARMGDNNATVCRAEGQNYDCYTFC